MGRLLEQGGMWSRRPCPGSQGRRQQDGVSLQDRQEKGYLQGNRVHGFAEITDAGLGWRGSSGGPGGSGDGVGEVSPCTPISCRRGSCRPHRTLPACGPAPSFSPPPPPTCSEASPGYSFIPPPGSLRDCCPESANTTSTRAPSQGSRLRGGRPEGPHTAHAL